MKRFQFIACGTVLWALLIASVQAQEEAVPDNDPDTPAETDGGALSLQELQTFADVFQQIRAGYVEEVADSTLFEYAVRGMLEGLDPHSAYLTREAYSDLQTTTEGEFSGLGIEIGRRGSYIEIIAPIDGSPAVEAGLQAGDVILKLDGQSVKGMTIDEAVKIMRGPVGSPIDLEIGRPGESEPFEVTVVRDAIKVASVRSRFLAPGYGYLRIAQFGRPTGDEAAAALGADVHPLPHADREMGRLARRQHEVVAERLVRIAGQRGQDVHAVAALARLEFLSGDRGQRGDHVDVRDELVRSGSRLDPARPAERHHPLDR